MAWDGTGDEETVSSFQEQLTSILESLDYFKMPPAGSENGAMAKAFSMVYLSLYEKLDQLQILAITDMSSMPFYQTTSGKSIPLPFFTPLKKLYIPKATTMVLAGKNIAWILIFLPRLIEASLACNIDSSDFDFLLEHQTVMAGLSNSMERLALSFTFVFDASKRKTWWGIPEEKLQIWKGGNKKSEALTLLLSIVKKVTSLELHHLFQHYPNPGDQTRPYANCIFGLQESFQTLRHLRLIEIGFNSSHPSSLVYDRFKNLRVLSVDHLHLKELSILKQLKSPSSLEVLVLLFYTFVDGEALKRLVHVEEVVVDILKSKRFPNLKEVVVPVVPINGAGESSAPEEYLLKWKQSRYALRRAVGSVKTGRVELRELRPGQVGE